MTTRRTVRLATALSALALVAAACGIGDWLDPSGSSSRQSPDISGLQIQPRSVFCDRPVVISFRYSDPQDDVDQVLLDFQHARLDERFSRSVSWEDPDLVTTEETAAYRFVFECGGPSAGDWTVNVQVEDRGGHLSNVLDGIVTLVSSR